MSRKSSDKDSVFDRLRVPGPPDDLRRRTLDRATRALGGTGRERDGWTRLWESRPARLVWAASVLALTLGHFILPIGGGSPSNAGSRSAAPAPGPTPMTATRDAPEPDELAAIADLPKLSLEGRPVTASAESDVDASTVPPEENAS
jgi:hypothetical protein